MILQRKVQTAEDLVVEVCGSLGCEQHDILNDFLSVDSGQPLSGWFSLQSILIILSDVPCPSFHARLWIAER